MHHLCGSLRSSGKSLSDKMAPETIGWEEIAWEKGYKGDSAIMLRELYLRHSQEELARLCGVGITALRKKLTEVGVGKYPTNKKGVKHGVTKYR